MAGKEGRVYYYDIDVLRGVLMSLGVVLHAAAYLLPGKADRRVALGVEAEVYNYLLQLIHLFRMPAFFIIAGFFCAMVLERYPPSVILRQRAIRLLVPALFCGLTTNLVLGTLSASGSHGGPQELQYWLGGQWLSHLWFLPVLYCYTVLFSILPAGSAKTADGRLPMAWVLLAVYLIYPVLCFIFIRLGWRLNAWPWGEYWFGILKMPDFFQYFPAFLLGVVLWRHGDIKALSRGRALLLHAGIGGLCLWGFFSSEADVAALAYLQELSGYLAAIPLSFLSIAAFDRIIQGPSRLGKFAAESSYTVYLLHMPILVILAAWIKEWGIQSPHMVFWFLFIATTVLCLAVHILIARSRLASLLFNGRYTPALGRSGQATVVRTG